MPVSLSASDLKVWLHRQLSLTDKLLVVLGAMDEPCQIQEIKAKAREAGFRVPPGTNPSSLLIRTHGKAIRSDKGWELTDVGRQHLSGLGVETLDPTIVNTAQSLQAELAKISNPDTNAHVGEAVHCYRYGLYRAATIMSWVGAVSILRDVIHTSHLSQFNADMKRVDTKWKDVVVVDDFSKRRESDFLDCIARLGVVGQDVKTQLKQCLTRRNSCGHPNSLQVSANTVAAHIEILVLNVFQRFG